MPAGGAAEKQCPHESCIQLVQQDLICFVILVLTAFLHASCMQSPPVVLTVSLFLEQGLESGYRLAYFSPHMWSFAHTCSALMRSIPVVQLVTRLKQCHCVTAACDPCSRARVPYSSAYTCCRVKPHIAPLAHSIRLSQSPPLTTSAAVTDSHMRGL